MSNRIIKFRAWNKNTSKMIDLKAITPLALSLNTDGLFLPFSEEVILMQCIGLIDKNGKEIFEGDVIEVKTKVPQYEDDVFIGNVSASGRFQVIYDAPCFDVERVSGELRDCAFYEADSTKEFKVVGNIYENPELLETSAETKTA